MAKTRVKEKTMLKNKDYGHILMNTNIKHTIRWSHARKCGLIWIPLCKIRKLWSNKSGKWQDTYLYLYKYENVCVCVCVYSLFSRPFRNLLGNPLTQSFLMLSAKRLCLCIFNKIIILFHFFPFIRLTLGWNDPYLCVPD